MESTEERGEDDDERVERVNIFAKDITVEDIEEELDRDPELLNRQNGLMSSNCETPLIASVMHENKDVMLYLLSIGADVEGYDYWVK